MENCFILRGIYSENTYKWLDMPLKVWLHMYKVAPKGFQRNMMPICRSLSMIKSTVYPEAQEVVLGLTYGFRI